MLTYSLLKMKREKTIMKLTGKKMKSMFLCMVLAVAMAFTVAGCGSKAEGTADAQKNTETAIVNTETIVETEAVAETESIETTEAQEIVLGDGSVKITVIVVDVDGNETNFVVNTDKETVGDALLEQNLIEGEDGDYGLYVKTVNGITADYDPDLLGILCKWRVCKHRCGFHSGERRRYLRV